MSKKLGEEIFEDIKKNYAKKQGNIPKKKLLKCLDCVLLIISILVLLAAMGIFSITIRGTNIILIIFCVLFSIVFIITKIISSKNKKYFKMMAELNQEFGKECLEEEAKKYNVSVELLSLYLLSERKDPVWVKVISFAISVFFTGYAVDKIPGYNPEKQPVIIFFMLVVANVIFSVCASFLSSLVQTTVKSDYEFYIIDPQREKIYAIEKNNVEDKNKKDGK